MKKLFLFMIVMLMPLLVFGKDGDEFSVEITEELKMYFTVLSESDKTVELTSVYNKNREDPENFTVPASVQGYTVKALGTGVFSGWSDLKNISIPSTVETIGSSAFKGCYSIINIDIPKGVSEICSHAFERCKNLNHLSLPSSLRTIGDYAFRGCSSLTEVVIPEGVTEIGYESFNIIEGGDWETCHITNAVIPSTVIKFSSNIFGRKTPVETLTIKCKSIPNTSFTYSHISHLILDGVESIEESAFLECEQLETISMSPSLRSIGGAAFAGCKLITEVIIPEGVTSIGSSAFAIDSRDYTKECNMTQAIVPSTVTELGESIFGSTPIKSLTIKCKDIPNSIFEGTGMLHLILDGVERIGDYAFRSSKSLLNVDLGNNLNSIGEEAFSGCESLVAIDIPESVTKVGNSCFYKCKRMVRASLPDIFTELPEGLFEQCLYLEDVNIPSKVTIIGNNAFAYCQKLVSIDIHEGITTIGNKAFYFCPSMKKITLPSTLRKIGDDAFSDEYNPQYGTLSEVYALMVDPAIESDIWNQPFSSHQYHQAILYVPTASLSEYKKTTPWKYFTNIQAIPEEFDVTGKVEIQGINGELLLGSSVRAKIIVSTTGSTGYAGPLKVTLSLDKDHRWIDIDEQTLTLTGEKIEQEVEVEFKGLKTDSIYSLVVWYQSEGKWHQVCESQSFQMVDPSYDLESRFEVPGLIKESDRYYHLVGDMSFDVSIFNPSAYQYDGRILLKLVTEDGHYAGELEQTASIKPGYTTTLNAKFNLTQDNVGGTYYVEAYYQRRGLMTNGGHSSLFTVVKYGRHNLSGLVSIVSPIIIDEGAVQVGSKQEIHLMFTNNTVNTYDGDMVLNLLQKKGEEWQQVFQTTQHVSIEGLKNGALTYTFDNLVIGETYCYEAYYYSFDQLVLYGRSGTWRMVDKNPYDDPSAANHTIETYPVAHKEFKDNPLSMESSWTEFVRNIVMNISGNQTTFDEWYQADCTEEQSPDGSGYRLKLYNFGSDIYGNDGTPPSTGYAQAEQPPLGNAFYYPNGEGTTSKAFSWGLSKEEIHNLIKDKNNPVTVSRWICFVAKNTDVAPYPYLWVKMTMEISKPEKDNSENITFKDPAVKKICVDNWDTNGDGELSYKEAAAVTDLNRKFISKSIKSFDEFQYFTGLEVIGNMYGDDLTFGNCTQMTSIILPPNLKTIHQACFAGCYSLRSIIIPQSVTYVGIQQFDECYDLTEIKVENGNAVYDSRENCNAIIETASDKLVAGCKTTFIPNGIKEIGPLAIHNCGITTLIIPSSVTKISSGGFHELNELTTFKVDSGNPVYDSRQNCNAIIETASNTLIAGCNVSVIPESVTAIGELAFSGYNGLTSVSIPKNVTKVGRSAFSNCIRLTSVSLPESVESIGEYAFYKCSALSSFDVNWQTPPAIAKTVFSNSDQNKATLFVPAGAKAAYEASEYWRNFKEIIEKETSSLNEMKDEVASRLYSIRNLIDQVMWIGGYYPQKAEKLREDFEGTNMLWYELNERINSEGLDDDVLQDVLKGVCNFFDINENSCKTFEEACAISRVIMNGRYDEFNYFMQLVQKMIDVQSTYMEQLKDATTIEEVRNLAIEVDKIHQSFDYLQVKMEDWLRSYAEATDFCKNIASWIQDALNKNQSAINNIGAEGQFFDVYSVSGRLVKKQTTTLDALPKGVYIVNGRKVVVK